MEQENLKLKVSASPHVRSKATTSDIMFDVVIALVPATAFGLYIFGWYAALLVAVCIGSCVGFEALYQKCMGKKVTVGDFSAVVTGLLLALNLPPNLPIWMAIAGSAFAIIIVKQLFGGLGQNFMNPALGARCFLLLSFSRYMTNFIYDGVATATPLATLKLTGMVNLRSMFLGYTAGTIGETSAVALLIGAVYLLIKRVISPKIPLIYIGTFAAAIAIYAAAKGYNVPVFTAAHLCGGGLMLGAWFMATDYVTSPITSVGKVIYAIGLGLLTFVLRIFGSSAEGVSYSIIIMNLLVPLIERVTVPKAFGEGAEVKDKKQAKLEAKTEKKEGKATAKAEETSAGDEKEPKKKDKMDVKGIVAAIVAICVITVIMGAALGGVYSVTKDPIEKAQEQAKNDAYAAVLPQATRVMSVEEDGSVIEKINPLLSSLGFENVTIDDICVGGDDANNTLVGYVVLVTSSEGYGGDIQIAVGMDTDYKITGLSFLTLNETAGLGMEADTDAFKQQFIGKSVDQFTYTKTGSTQDSEIDALSGATITTSAVTNAVNAALRTIQYLTAGGAQ